MTPQDESYLLVGLVGDAAPELGHDLNRIYVD